MKTPDIPDHRSSPRRKTDRKRRPLAARRAAITLFAAYTAVLAAVSILNFLGPERWWVTGFLQYAPQWIWAIPCLVLAPLALWLCWKWAWLPVLQLIWVAGPMMGFTWQAGRSPASSSPTRMRVMTYNIQWGRGGWGKVARQVVDGRPDLLLIQDARGGFQGALKEVLSSWKVLSFGQFHIASKLDIRDPVVGDVSYRGKKHTYLSATLRLEGTSTLVSSVHFATPRSGLEAMRSGDRSAIDTLADGMEDRLSQARSVAAQISRKEGPIILGGDLNAPPNSLVCRSLEKIGLQNAFSLAGFGYGYTFGHKTRLRHAYLRIDHLYTSRHWKPLRCFAPPGEGSDHYPVIADLALDPRAAAGAGAKR